MNASRNRKIVYLLLIVAMFTLQIPLGGYIERAAARQRLAQKSLGNVDPVSGTAQLVCFGFRGVAVTFLWNEAIELNKKERWFEIEPVLNSITLLQPNFSSPWQYQAWNMAYNIAAQWEAVRDKYYWISKGAKFMKEACDKNAGVSDLLWYTGWIYHHRFSVSDEYMYFREEFRRDTDVAFVTNSGNVQWDRPDGKRDPFECGYYWFNEANEVILRTLVAPKRMGITPFMTHPAKAKTTFAEFLEKEGYFGANTRNYWRTAAEAWLYFGKGFGLNMPHAGPGRNTLVHRLEFDPPEWNALSEEDKYWAMRFGNIVRYNYWKVRTREEATEQMEHCRQLFYNAEAKTKDGNYEDAIVDFERAFPAWRALLEEKRNQELRTDQPLVEDTQTSEAKYLELLPRVNRQPPAKRPFEGFFDALEPTPTPSGPPPSPRPATPSPTPDKNPDAARQK